MKEYWKTLKHDEIIDGYEISTSARVRAVVDPSHSSEATYHSTNGYDFIPLIIKELYYERSITRHFPIDDLVAQTFIPIPDKLIGKPVKVEHIDGNLRNNHYENLRWVEDIEEWRDVGGFEGLYRISNHGRCFSVRTGAILRPGKSRKYLMNAFSINGKMHCYLTHRLVAAAFYGNIDNIEVNHINEKSDDNHLKNLEIVSKQRNNSFGTRNTKIGINHRGGSKRRPVKCVETGEIFPEIAIAGREKGINKTGIWRALQDPEHRTFGGFHWEYYNIEIEEELIDETA